MECIALCASWDSWQRYFLISHRFSSASSSLLLFMLADAEVHAAFLQREVDQPPSTCTWRKSYTFLVNMRWEFAGVMQTCCIRTVQCRCRRTLDASQVINQATSKNMLLFVCMEWSVLNSTTWSNLNSVWSATRTVWRNSVLKAANRSCTHPIVTGSRGPNEPRQRQTMLYDCASTSCSIRLICVCMPCRLFDSTVTIRLSWPLISISFSLAHTPVHKHLACIPNSYSNFMFGIMLRWQFSLRPNNFIWCFPGEYGAVDDKHDDSNDNVVESMRWRNHFDGHPRLLFCYGYCFYWFLFFHSDSIYSMPWRTMDDSCRNRLRTQTTDHKTERKQVMLVNRIV